ncbi:type VI secretion system contractile sheath small subunit [Salmonella enterica subsp. enterica]|nr:type VI secretion system contractile sheath small subunit [Salmonella enterica subsp. enterica]
MQISNTTTQRFTALRKIELLFRWRWCWPIRSGNREELPPVTDRKFLDIDIDNFNERMKAIAPRVCRRCAEYADGQRSVTVDITLVQYGRLSPAQIARKCGTP